MASADPVLIVLFSSSAAAALAALGAAPFFFRDSVPLNWVGGAYALASGFMLGVGYLLMLEGVRREVFAVVFGFGLGALYTAWSQTYAGIAELDTRPGGAADVIQGYKTILQNALHSASEGVAIGAAMVVSLKLGVFLAFSLAIHNVGEAMALTASLRERKISVGQAAGICVITKVPQILLAIVAFAVTPAMGAAVPAALGFASGALVFLLMTELIPASYQRCSSSSVAIMVSFSAGAVVLLGSVLI